MNIVLATVLERTREIGIRRSIGARRFDIVRQFSDGIGADLCGRRAAGDCVWVSVVVGVVFGIYPAMKGSRVNPIEALRYE